jgi:hypothetical protein
MELAKMTRRKVTPFLMLLFLNGGIGIGMLVGYFNKNVDRFSLLAIGGLALLVFNGMFFIFRRTEPDLPPDRLKLVNKWVLWPILALCALI